MINLKEKFLEYTKLNEEDLSLMCEKSIVVFDSSILLQLYNISEETVNTFFSILDKIKDRIWLPYHVCEEYYCAKYKKIIETYQSRDSVLSDIEKIERNCNDCLLKTPFYQKEEIESFNNKLIELKKEFKKISKKVDLNYKCDTIENKIIDVFGNQIGDKISEDRYKQLEADGKIRYDSKIPPGYMDDSKENNKYGDYIIWDEIVSKSKKEKKPILLITLDNKEDWILQYNKNKYMPHPKLRRELHNASGQNFHIYDLENFMNYFGQKYLGDTYKRNGGEIKKELRKINYSQDNTLQDYISTINKKAKEFIIIGDLNNRGSVETIDKINKIRTEINQLEKEINEIDREIRFSDLKSSLPNQTEKTQALSESMYNRHKKNLYLMQLEKLKESEREILKSSTTLDDLKFITSPYFEKNKYDDCSEG